MAGNGSYAGSILFMGIDQKILDNEEDRKNLNEIGSIIQNKINLQRHDLAAKAKSDFLARMSHERNYRYGRDRSERWTGRKTTY